MIIYYTAYFALEKQIIPEPALRPDMKQLWQCEATSQRRPYVNLASAARVSLDSHSRDPTLSGFAADVRGEWRKKYAIEYTMHERSLKGTVVI